MTDVRIITGKKRKVNKEQTLAFLGQNSRYEKLFTQVAIQAEMRLQPKAAVAIDDEEKYIYVILTLGKEISVLQQEYFERGQAEEALLTNTIANVAYFSFEQEVLLYLKNICKTEQFGVKRRLEAPIHIPLTIHEKAMKKTEAAERLKVSLTNGFMFEPEKTGCILFQISENPEEFQLEHSCRDCDFLECETRKKTFLEVLKAKKQSISAFCNGKGTCGKCKIKLESYPAPYTEAEKKLLSDEDKNHHIRLACQVLYQEGISYEIVEKEETLEILGIGGETTQDKIEEPCIAVDIGTTTIAAALFDGKTGHILSEWKHRNDQRNYGADIMSRMAEADQGKAELLQKLVQGNVDMCMEELLRKKGLKSQDLRNIYYVGNTAMQHLFCGYPVNSLIKYPFKPYSVDKKIWNEKEIFLPSIDGFVGSDVLVGITTIQPENDSLYVDLGTNGEIGIYSDGKWLFTSTAAGPAFEGSGLTSGCASVGGAITSIEYQEGKLLYNTIQKKPAVGICGSGYISGLSMLLREGKMDATGLLAEEYREKGFPITGDIKITQEDIRKLQMAKSAIYTGIEMLSQECQIKRFSKIYLAGGFGYACNTEDAKTIGLLPKEGNIEIQFLGNAALIGAVEAGYIKGRIDYIEETQKLAKVCSFAGSELFEQLFIQNLNF